MKRASPKKRTSKINVKDINDIEKKMLLIKSDSVNNSGIQMPTQNIIKKNDVKSFPEQSKENSSKTKPSKPSKTSKTNPKPTKTSKTKPKPSKTKPSRSSRSSKTKPSKTKPSRSSRSSRSSRPSRPSRSSRPSNQKMKGRKISIKTRVFNENDIKKVENRIKEIRSKKKSDIKKELTKQGIKVSGKSDRLLKDIYFYSQMSNINIIHEK